MRLPLIFGVMLMTAAAPVQSQTAQPQRDWRLVIHGGAGTIERAGMTSEKDAAIRAALNGALEAGARILASGGNALDAVEATVKMSGRSPFQRRAGSVFTYDGTHELDASIWRAHARGGIGRRCDRDQNPSTGAHGDGKDPHVLLAARRGSLREGAGVEQPQQLFLHSGAAPPLDELESKKLSALDVEYNMARSARWRSTQGPCRGRDLDRRTTASAGGGSAIRRCRRWHLRRRRGCASPRRRRRIFHPSRARTKSAPEFA